MKKSYCKFWSALVSWCTVLCLVSVYSQASPFPDVSNSKKILVVGDSLSAAYKLPKEKGWVHLMEKKLRETHPSYQVINASVSGATTAAGIVTMEKALASHRPNIVILELGANDGLQGKPVNYITKNLDRLIRMSKEVQANVLLVGIRLPPNFGTRYTEPFFQQYETLSRSHELPLVPFLLEGVAGDSTLMMSDGLHPNEAGQVLLLNNVWPVLEKML